MGLRQLGLKAQPLRYGGLVEPAKERWIAVWCLNDVFKLDFLGALSTYVLKDQSSIQYGQWTNYRYRFYKSL